VRLWIVKSNTLLPIWVAGSAGTQVRLYKYYQYSQHCGGIMYMSRRYAPRECPQTGEKFKGNYPRGIVRGGNVPRENVLHSGHPTRIPVYVLWNGRPNANSNSNSNNSSNCNNETTKTHLYSTKHTTCWQLGHSFNTSVTSPSQQPTSSAGWL